MKKLILTAVFSLAGAVAVSAQSQNQTTTQQQTPGNQTATQQGQQQTTQGLQAGEQLQERADKHKALQQRL